MTQFKDKSDGQDSVRVDLFTYPVLQAADILLYQADRVPVGDDQRQHLELARNIAQRFNSASARLFPLPEAAIPASGGRVMDLQEPDNEDVDHRRHAAGHRAADRPARGGRQEDPLGGHRLRPRGAPRRGQGGHREPDRDPRRWPPAESPEADRGAYDGEGYGQFKGDVADAVVELLRPIRERYLELRADEMELGGILARGRDRASQVADRTLAEMLDAMGFRVPPRGG